MISLCTVVFLGSETHDLVVCIAGFFGFLALPGCMMEFYKMGYYNLIIHRISCALIFLLIFYIYETGNFRQILPVIQKLTFVLFLFWFALLDLHYFAYAG